MRKRHPAGTRRLYNVASTLCKRHVLAGHMSEQIVIQVCLFVCAEVFTAQSIQWGHVEQGHFA